MVIRYAKVFPELSKFWITTSCPVCTSSRGLLCSQSAAFDQQSADMRRRDLPALKVSMLVEFVEELPFCALHGPHRLIQSAVAR